MLDVSVKTLDGTNRSYSLQDDITVKEFKEKISENISIAVDRQRLIFQGRVLQDDKKLSEYNVQAKVIHVVERPPPDMRRPTGVTAGSDRTRRAGQSGPPGGLSIGAFSVPDIVDPNHIQNLVQQTLSGMGEMGRNARVTSRTSNDGSAVDVHINLTRNGAQVLSESQQRISHARRLLAHVKYTLGQLENSSSTDSTTPVDANSTAPVDPALASPINSPPEFTISASGSEVTSGSTSAAGSNSSLGSSDSTTSSSALNNSGSSNVSNLATPNTDNNECTTSSTQSAATNTQSAVTSAPSAVASAPSATNTQSAATCDPSAVASAPSAANSTKSAANSAPSAVASAPSAVASAPSAANSAESAVASARCTSTSAETTTTTSTNAQSASTSQTTPNSQTSTQALTEEHPETKQLSDLMGELEEVEQRLLPYRQRYYRLMVEDPEFQDQSLRAESQRLYNYVSSCLHHLGHVYHHISDLLVDFTSQRPRRLRAAANPPPVPTAVIHQTIPVQAQVSLISTGPVRRGARSRSRGANARSSTANQNAQVTTNTPLTTSTTPSTGGATTNPAASTGTTTTANIGGSSTSTSTVRTSTTTTGTSTDPLQGRIQFPPGAFGAGNFAPGGPNAPMMFMEVGPNSVSVNSISAHVVREGDDHPSMENLPPGVFTSGGFPAFHMAAGPGAPGAPAGARAPPPDFMNNLIRMAQQASVRMTGPRGMNPPPQPGQHLAPPSTNAPPPSENNTPPSGTASGTTTPPTGDAGSPSGGGQNHPGQVPRLPPIMQMDNRSVDPFMICNSRHYLPMRQHPSRQNGEAAVSEVVNNLIGALVQGGGTSGVPTSTTTSAQSTGASTQAAGSAPTAPINPFAGLLSGLGGAAAGLGGPTTGMGGATGTPVNTGNFAESLRQLLQQQASQSGTPEAGPAGPTGTGGASAQRPMSDDVFVDMVTGITSNLGSMMAGQPQQTTLLDFLSSIDPSHQVVSGEGIVNDFYLAMSRSLTFPDLIQIFSGSSAPLQPLRPTLQQFIQEKVLLDGEVTEENVDQAIERLMEEENVHAYLADMTSQSGVQVEPTVDLPATLMSFISHQMRILIHLIMDSEGTDSSFHERLFGQCRSGLHELIVLCRGCLQNGMDGVDTLLRNRVGATSLTSVANPIIRTWLVNMASHNLNTLSSQVTITNRDVQHYIVRKSATDTMDIDSSPPEVISTSTSQPNTDDTSSSVADNRTPLLSNGVTPSNRIHSDSEESFEDAVSSMDTSSDNAERVTMETDPATLLQNGSISPPAQPMGDWRSVVPEEWVPIISRDQSTQEQQSSRQAPFSDAYVSGMPAKRRRVMLPEHSLLAPGDRNVPAIVNQSLRDAIRVTGIRPVTSLDSVQRHLAEESDTLTLTYQQQVVDDIQKRLRDDPDYSKDKFPSTDKYFEGGRK